MNEKEEWKSVVGFEGLYEVSNTGSVRSVDRIVRSRWGGMKKHGVMLKQQTSRKGYKTIVLHKENYFYQKQVHRLVAEAFIPNPTLLSQVNHKDMNKANNHVENLEWISGLDNMRHAYANKCYQRTQRQDEHSRIAQREMAIRRRRQVAMVDINSGDIIGIFRSITDAEKVTGIEGSKITSVCKGHRHQTGGYKWEYLEDKE